MARIRTIKPEIWTSEPFVECSSNARLLFLGMLNFADDNGVHAHSCKRLKMEIFPGDYEITEQDVHTYVQELEQSGLVMSYEVHNTKYLLIKGFAEHQRVDRPNYRYPNPLGEIAEYSMNARRSFDDHSTTDPPRKGREGKGKEGKERITSVCTNGFAHFWEQYPRKVNRKRAEQAWTKLAPSEELAATITEAVTARAAGDPQWRELRYVPHASTYLRGAQWEDDWESATKDTFKQILDEMVAEESQPKPPPEVPF